MLKKAFYKAMFLTLIISGIIMLVISISGIDIDLKILMKYVWEITSSISCIALGLIGLSSYKKHKK